VTFVCVCLCVCGVVCWCCNCNHRHLQLCWEEIKPTLVTKLGQGSFGQVYEGWYHSAPMAVKIINVDRCSGTDPLHTISGKGFLQAIPPASKNLTIAMERLLH